MNYWQNKYLNAWVNVAMQAATTLGFFEAAMPFKISSWTISYFSISTYIRAIWMAKSLVRALGAPKHLAIRPLTTSPTVLNRKENCDVIIQIKMMNHGYYLEAWAEFSTKLRTVSSPFSWATALLSTTIFFMRKVYLFHSGLFSSHWPNSYGKEVWLNYWQLLKTSKITLRAAS